MSYDFIPNYYIFSNSLKQYIIAVVIFLIAFFVFRIFQRVILNRLAKVAGKTRTDIDDRLIEVIRSIKPRFYLVLSIWIALKYLVISPLFSQIIDAGLTIFIVYQLVVTVQLIINFIAKRHLEADGSRSLVALISGVAKFVLWSFGILLILSNLGINVTSLIAGLGIGGIAVALAAQSILGDVFSSLVIYFDKPFTIGDFITFDGEAGTVERVGFRTTRIRSIKGEEIVVSNTDLTSQKVHNYKKMENRRIVFNLGVTYGTSSAKLRKIPKMIKEIIKGVKETEFDRVHFNEFGDSALLFEVVYYVKSSDYSKYMDINQKINLKIKDAFRKEEIEMAFPTQTIYLDK